MTTLFYSFPAAHVKKLIVHFILLSIFLICFYNNLHAQKEANNWYFGEYAGLSFNTTPPTALTDGALSTREGCSSISDQNGNLLFYSDGKTVWNKNHQIMDNGEKLNGDGSSTQSSLIVKQPSSNTLYYIFTVPDQDDAGAYEYSIVDLSYNSGLGKITTKNQSLLKDFSDPTSEFTDFTEALTATYHSNQTDIWIVVHQRYTTTFYSYLITSTGIQNPVTSTAGFQKQYLGQFRVSPDGKRIALAGYYATGTDLYDFNATTGNISNAISLIGTANTNANRIYGLSFSANSNVLYVTDAVSVIYQFDLSLPTATAIVNSKTTIGQGSSHSYPQLQLGPDKRIYLAQGGQHFLGVIEHPDIPGAGCSFLDNGISLSTQYSALGLPTFMVNYVTQRAPVVSLNKDTTLCPGTSVILDAGENKNGTFLWNTKAQTQTITVTTPGKYYVDVTRDNTTVSDTIIVSFISFDSITIPHSYNYCVDKDSVLQLNPGFSETHYSWQDGSSALPYTIKHSGVYWLERYNQNCRTKDAFTVTSVCELEMIIPNLITPNNDGQNENFAIKNLPIPNWNLEIYNRWGALVYSAEGYQNNWGSQNVTDGIYYYHLKHRYSDETHKGWLQVLGAVK